MKAAAPDVATSNIVAAAFFYLSLNMCRCLHFNQVGCAMRCPASCCLHVYFSNVGLVIKPDELMLWLATVKSLYTGHAPAAAHEADTQHIRLHSPVDGLVLLFSLNEL